MLTRIPGNPGNVVILIFQAMFMKIPGNAQKNSEEYSRRFRVNVPKNFRECTRRFWGIFQKIPGNV